MKLKQITLLKVAAAMILTTAMIGCGPGDMVGSAVNDANKTNVARIANAYGMFQMKTQGFRGPKDKAEFQQFLSDNADQVAAMGIEDYDALFTSERDNAEIKVRWNVPGSSRGCYEPVAFETVGVGGAKLVGFVNGTQEEVSDGSKYDSMFDGTYKADGQGTDTEIPKFDKSGNQIN